MLHTAKKLSKVRVVRFILAGGTAALVEFLAFLILLKLIHGVFWPAIVSFGCGFITSYLLNSRVVFASANKRSRKREGFQASSFLLLGICNAFISSWMVVVFAHYIPESIAKLCAMAVIAVWNYIIMKNLIFRDHSNIR